MIREVPAHRATISAQIFRHLVNAKHLPLRAAIHVSQNCDGVAQVVTYPVKRQQLKSSVLAAEFVEEHFSWPRKTTLQEFELRACRTQPAMSAARNAAQSFGNRGPCNARDPGEDTARLIRRSRSVPISISSRSSRQSRSPADRLPGVKDRSLKSRALSRPPQRTPWGSRQTHQPDSRSTVLRRVPGSSCRTMTKSLSMSTKSSGCIP